MDQKDAKLLGAVYSLLLEHGAMSIERMLYTLAENGIWTFERDIRWAFYQLDCSEGGELWTLPDRMLPLNERDNSRDETIVETISPDGGRMYHDGR